jgi:c-di-GMP-binding flagellar brake protein YcgR
MIIDEESRTYQRGVHLHIDARFSEDGTAWQDAQICDISSGGMQVQIDKHYNKGDRLWFDLIIHHFFSQFELKVRGVIRQELLHEGRHLYGVQFLNLTPEMRIRIDECVLSDRPVSGTPFTLN